MATPIRILSHSWKRFRSSELSGAGLLVLATMAALAWANIGGDSYDNFWHTTFTIQFGHIALDLDLRHWLNDAGMALFFLLVSLEVKHDLVMGELHDRKQARLPLIAAAGGLVIPALLFLAINHSDSSAGAWGVVISTDTAFVLGLLAIFGSSIPGPLRAFLLTLAVADDVGALAVIAVVYTEQITIGPLVTALVLAIVVFAMQRWQTWRVGAYLAIGVLLWLAVYASGVHATIAGVVVGLLLPVYPPKRSLVQEADQLTQSFRRTPTVATGRAAAAGITRTISVNERLQRMLHSWVGLLIVPIFALANAGVRMNGEVFAQAAASTLFWGIIAGLVVGKFGGIVLSTATATRLGIGKLGPGLKHRHIAGGAMLTGIGFTISLFIVDLALQDPTQQAQARIGVLVASGAAGLIGMAAFGVITAYDRAHAPARTRLVRPVEPAEDHLSGVSTAPLQLVEYGRFGGVDDDLIVDIVDDLRDHFDDELVYVFRHNPLDEPVAQQAAEAIEAVGDQAPQLFWRMRRELTKISVDSELDLHEIRRAAVTVGSNLARMEDSIRRGEFSNRVNRDVLDAETMHLIATPRFFINDVIYDGPTTRDSLRSALQSALDEAAARTSSSASDDTTARTP